MSKYVHTHVYVCMYLFVCWTNIFSLSISAIVQSSVGFVLLLLLLLLMVLKPIIVVYNV